MEFAVEAPLRRPAEQALDLLVGALSALSFRVVSQTSVERVLEGPSYTSTKQSPLLGASPITVRVERDRLVLRGELHGARRMGLFATFFPPALGLVLCGVFLVVRQFQPQFALVAAFIPLVVTAPWLIIGPLMARWIHQRTCAALQTLVDNCAG